MINKNTFKQNMKDGLIYRCFHPKQLDFFGYTLDVINNDRDTDKLTVLAARCGLGKSTFLQVLIKSWLVDNPKRGLIVVTDSLKRLERFNDDTDFRIAYLTSENKSTEIVRQSYCPVLLMSTQRFFQMESIEPFLTYYDGEKKYNRDTIIFDESPYFRQISEIGIEQLNIIHSALNDGITDLCRSADKEWAVSQYDFFREKMIETINSLEQQRNQTTYLFYQPSIGYITEDDARFLKIIDDSSAQINRKYPNFSEVLNNVFDFLHNGGFFSSFKLHDSNVYHKSFIMCKDNLDKFMLGKGVKTFIFDGTANISELYPDDAEWLTIHDCNQFNVPLDYMNVHLIDVNTSRNALINQAERNTKLTAIKNYINKLNVDVDDTLFVSYKPLIESNEFANIGFSSLNSMYFGNTKGYNEHSDKHTFIQVGLNRQTDINYLLMMLANNDDFNLRVKNDLVHIEDNITEIDSLLKSDIAAGYMSAEVTADFIQNLFRTAARDLTNRDTVDVYLFCRNTEYLMMELEYALGRLGAKITVETLDELDIAKIKNRKAKTNAQKVIEWLEAQPIGREFLVDEFLIEVGIEAKNFRVTKRKNTFIQKLFDEMKIKNTRGKYKIIR